jgi:hypothetical protein
MLILARARRLIIFRVLISTLDGKLLRLRRLEIGQLIHSGCIRDIHIVISDPGSLLFHVYIRKSTRFVKTFGREGVELAISGVLTGGQDKRLSDLSELVVTARPRIVGWVRVSNFLSHGVADFR